MPSVFFQSDDLATAHLWYYLDDADKSFSTTVQYCKQLSSAATLAGFETLEHKLATRKIIKEYGKDVYCYYLSVNQFWIRFA